MREDNSRENATYVYVYNGNGNILEKNKYASGYTDAAHKDTAGSVSYTYSTGDWKDLLTNIGSSLFRSYRIFGGCKILWKSLIQDLI